MPSPHGETELRRLRTLVSTSKHYQDAYEASTLRLIPAEYPSALFALNHVAHYGYRAGDDDRIDTGHAASKPPTYDAWAMEYLARERRFMQQRGLAMLMRVNHHLHGEEAKGDIA